MSRLNDIVRERDTMGTIVKLTNAFEGVASMRISAIKDQVLQSQRFFDELWRIYSQIRVDELFHFGRGQSVDKLIEKELMILITSEGSFSGDIDQKLISEALQKYQPAKNDIIAVGTHGAILLTHLDISYIKNFKLPEQDRNINVLPIVEYVQKYASTTVFYQNYLSLADLRIKNIKLSTAVAERGKKVTLGEDVITEENYIFEPSTYDVVNHLESSMMQITLSEVILESKLAQYASRFSAMSVAHDRANDSYADLDIGYSRAKRYIKDERLKEVINSLKKATA